MTNRPLQFPRGWLAYALGAALRLALCLGISFVLFERIAASEQGANSFVAAIYAYYQGADPRGLQVHHAGEIALRAYFEPSLAALISNDWISARADAGKLDFDPFVESRDTDLNGVNISISVADRPADQVVAIVTFTRGTEKIKEVRLDLVRQGNEWRISNIHWGERDLRMLLTRTQ